MFHAVEKTRNVTSLTIFHLNVVYISIFFRTAIRPEKVCIVIDNTTFPIFKNSQALQEAANSWCALPAILLNKPFSYMLSFNNTKL